MGLIKTLSAVAFFGAALYSLACLSTITIASSGLFPTSKEDIPPFGLGTWLSEQGKVAHAVEYALKSGYRHIDAARVYGNEKEVGQGIKASGVSRQDIWVTSKLWNNDHRPERAREAIEKTISDLGVDYLDLYLIHWPVAFVPGDKDNKIDEDTSIVDTWRALEDLVRANRTRYIGISNFSPADVQTILDAATIRPYAHEFETHPYLQQQAFVDFHAEQGIQVIAYSPLANTNPTYDPDVPSILDDPHWKAIAGRKKASVAQTVLAWGLQRGTIVIPKSVHEKYIDENLGALDIHFSEADLAQVAKHDKKIRLNNPGKKWGVDLFQGLDDPAKDDDDDDDASEL